MPVCGYSRRRDTGLLRYSNYKMMKILSLLQTNIIDCLNLFVEHLCKRVSLKLSLAVEEIFSKLKDILGKDPFLVVKADSFHR